MVRGTALNPDRRLFDKLMKDPSSELKQGGTDPSRFMRAIITYQDPLELLARLTNQQERGRPLLRQALCADDSHAFVSQWVIPFLELLGSDVLNRGSCIMLLEQVVGDIWKLPGFLTTLLRTVRDETVGDLSPIIWFATKVAQCHTDARDDPRFRELCVALHDHPGARALNTIMSSTVATSATDAPMAGEVMALEDVREHAGGRHSNDHADYRRIAIMPSVEEVTCPRSPYLPPPGGVLGSSKEAALLDRQFRLLREDFVGPARTELKDLKDLSRRPYGFNLRFLSVGVQPGSVFLRASFDLPHFHPVAKLKKKKERKEAWENGNHRFFPLNSLVCLMRGEKPIRFATVASRSTEELAEDPPIIGLAFSSESMLADSIAEINHHRSPGGTLLVQVSSSYFSYEPVLRCLQSMDQVAFAEELVHGEPPLPLTYLPTSECMEQALASYTLDESQRRAVELGLTQRISIIQGPPGTGKTFIGALLAQLILAHSDEKIQCICYTNHALDQFLEYLEQRGISSMVRIGSRSKNAAMEKFNLRELTQKTPASGVDRRRVAILYKEVEELEKEIKRLEKNVGESPCWWRGFGDFVRDSFPELGEQLTVPEQLLRRGSGFQMVGPNGQALKSDYLWKAWRQGKGPGALETHVHRPRAGEEDAWAMGVEDRKSLRESMEKEYMEGVRAELVSAMVECERLKKELRSIHDDDKRAVLRGVRVIGCTTSGAAIHKALLDDAAAGVVLVEEAGEILESHVLTSLSKSTKHLILIGDHKQLRPKLESFPLSVEAGHGHDFNRSLFERLVTSSPGFPYASLQVQHRMRPEISALVKPTYPHLQDHESVLRRPKVRGVADNVVFIDHRVPEESQDPSGNRQSKVNLHEVNMVVSVVRYLVQQGYKPAEMVVLTPYLGQLVALQRALAGDFRVLVDQLDLNDLRKNGMALEGAGGKGRAGDEEEEEEEEDVSDQGVRVATIDNYQGEEADIVVVSLVRSNGEGRIGFLREPERVNVMLSRSRCGLLLLGNTHTLTHASDAKGRELWQSLLQRLRGRVRPGLPALCQVHLQPAAKDLSTPAMFSLHAPDGGCTRPCGVTLPCSHPCPKACHAFDREHRSVVCAKLVLRPCPQGHVVEQACGVAAKGREVACDTCAELRRIAQRHEEERRRRAKKHEALRAEAELRRKELEEQAQTLREEVAALRRSAEAQVAAVAAELDKQTAEKEAEARAQASPLEVEAMVEQARRQAEERMQRLEKERQEALERAQQVEEEARQRIQRLEQSAALDERKVSAAIANVREANRSVEKTRACLDALRGVSNPGGLDSLRSRARDPDSGMWAALGLLFAGEGFNLADAVIRHAQAEGGAQEEAGGEKRAHSRPLSGPVKRVLTLLEAGKYHDAIKLTKAGGELRALYAYCCVQIFGADAEWDVRNALSACDGEDGDVVPLLVRALLYEAKIRSPQTSPDSVPSLRTRAFGYALAYVVHPHASTSLPGSFREAAMGLLKAHGPSLGAVAAAGSNGPLRAGTQEEQWRARAQRLRSKALQELVALTGMSSVKRACFELHDMVQLDKERGVDIKQQQHSALFYGNPGTGKTTVARLYARLLEELGVLPSSAMEETSGAKLAHGGVKELTDTLKKLDKGGLLFIDEAYQLKPSTNRAGAEVLDFLLPEIENQRGKLVVVLAGYQKQMEELIAYNEGLPSRFPRVFNFVDYSEAELLEILKGIADSAKPRFTVADPKFLRIAARRLAAMRGTPGFGNARAARNLYEQSRARQAARVQRLNEAGTLPQDPQERKRAMLQLERDDLLGPRELDLTMNKPLRELEGMVGLESIKAEVRNLLELVKTNAELEEEEKQTRKVNLNRLFLGNPGTGKTTVATIYGKVLRELGLLSKGDVVIKNPSDFIGSVLGESEKRTSEILEAARGCVLVIDEAYGLHSSKGMVDPYKTGVIDTIVAKVQGVPGDDRCVLMIGYEEQMKDMLREANPGLARRFQLDAAWRFEDYDDAALCKILRGVAVKAGLDLSVETTMAAVELLAKERMKPNFGNAGAVNNLLSQAMARMERRLQHLSPLERARHNTLEPCDFGIVAEGEARRADDKIFADLIGCQEVMRKLKEYQSTIAMGQAKGLDPLAEMELNFLFVGSPGTGKTTVARRMGLLFESLGLLASSEVVECSASDFLTGYANQASGKTRDIFERALGTVLFVDEAYRLNPRRGGPMVNEVLDEMVQLLTEPRFRNKMVFILAGYEQDIDELMSVNAGLKSRMSERLHFADFSEEDARQLLLMRLKSKGLALATEAERELSGMVARLVAAPNWSNGRDVDTWAKRIFRAFSQRCTQPGFQGDVYGDEEPVQVQDLEASLQDFLRSKTQGSAPAVDPASTLTPAYPPMDVAGAAAPTMATEARRAVVTEWAGVDAQDGEEEEAVARGGGSAGDEGIPREFLVRLQAALDARGLAEKSAVAALANGPMPADLLEELGDLKDVATRWQADWREKEKERERQEIELKKKKQAPVWRCAVCGRYGCSFAPYIESYQEIDA